MISFSIFSFGDLKLRSYKIAKKKRSKILFTFDAADPRDEVLV